MRARTVLLTCLVVVLALVACSSFPANTHNPDLSPSSEAADNQDLGLGDGRPRKDLQCDGDQQSETKTAVIAACAFDRGGDAERAAEAAAENEVARDYAVAMDSYMSQSDVQAYIAELREIPQPERAKRGQYLLEHNHIRADCAFDRDHPPDYSHARDSYILIVGCDPRLHGVVP